jgi:hypothetical protein
VQGQNEGARRDPGNVLILASQADSQTTTPSRVQKRPFSMAISKEFGLYATEIVDISRRDVYTWQVK